MFPDSSRNLIIAVSKQCSPSMCRSRLSRAATYCLISCFLDFPIANLFMILLVSISHRSSCSITL